MRIERVHPSVALETSVPLQTPLYPETLADRSTLHRAGDAYVLRTYFCEHAPGHGWSREQTEDETLDSATLRARLATVERAEIERA